MTRILDSKSKPKGRGKKIYPKIAPDFGQSSRRIKGRILFVCNLLCNPEDGPKDKQDGINLFFRGPNILLLP